MCDIGLLFPKRIQNMMQGVQWRKGLEEIRVRVGQPVEFLYSDRDCFLRQKSGAVQFVSNKAKSWMKKELVCVGENEINEMVNYISNYSLYAYKEELRHGFITIEGGHRIGIAGQTVMQNGKLEGICPITFLNIRLACEHIGCAKELMHQLRDRNSIYNTLFFSVPGVGKTTLLRECIRLISEGDDDFGGMRVGVVDERSEIAACYHGVPQNDVGVRTDVLDGCRKSEGIRMLIRSMSPQVVGVDELSTQADFMAVEQAVYSGSKVFGTVHAGSIKELSEKPFLQKWMKKQIFERFVWIEKELDGKRKTTIYNADMERVC